MCSNAASEDASNFLWGDGSKVTEALRHFQGRAGETNSAREEGQILDKTVEG